MISLHHARIAAITFALTSTTAYATIKDAELASTIDKIVTRHARRFDIPGGALGVVLNGKVVLQKVAGNRGQSKAESIDPQTMFQIGSIAKTFSAAIAAQYVEAGKLSFSDPIGKFLPKRCVKQLCQEMTVAHLLSHSTGISADGVNEHIERGGSYDEVITKALAAKRLCAPGKCFEYNNAAYELVREIFEVIDKRPYAEILNQRLLAPLKMIRTNSTYEELKRSDNFFMPHVFLSGRFVETSHSTAYYNLPGSSVLNSSLVDMLKFVAAELGDAPDVISPTALKLMHTSTIGAPDLYTWMEKAPGLKSTYGLGHRMLEYPDLKIIFHTGWVKGCKSLIVMVPQRRLGFVLLQNSGSQLGFRVLEDFARQLRAGR